MQKLSNFFPLTTKKVILVFVFIGFLSFGRGLFNGFSLDDNGQILSNDLIHSLGNIALLFLGSSFGNAGGLIGIYYKPMMTTVFTIIYSLFGVNPFPYHFIQLVLHIANSILIFYFLKKFIKSISAFILSVIFLVHPINSEVVYYASNFQDVLYMFFGLLALNSISKKILHLKNYVLFSIFTLLSFFSKETGIFFAFVAIAYRFFYASKTNSLSHELKKILTASAIIFISYFLFRISFSKLGITSNTFPIEKLSFAGRLLNIPEILFFYIKTALFPINLAVAQQWVVTKANFFTFTLPLIADLVFLFMLSFLGKIINKKNKDFLG